MLSSIITYIFYLLLLLTVQVLIYWGCLLLDLRISLLKIQVYTVMALMVKWLIDSNIIFTF
jgi:hypothetical protein